MNRAICKIFKGCRGAQPCAPTRENDPVNKHKNLTRRIYHRIAILFILLLAAGLRFHALAQDTRFHPDEALFATFARGAAVNGDWLLHGALDKPPLTIYADALSMMVVGVTTLPDGVLTLDAHRGEFAARLPGTLASLVLVAVMFPLTRRLYPRAGAFPALAAMLLMALSPYAVAFSATAFTDGLMLLCLALALWMSAAGRWGWAGFWLAVGFGCKQQALLYVPLVAAVLWIARQTDYHRAGTLACPYKNPWTRRGDPTWSPVERFARWLRLIVPLVIGVILLFAWDGLRGQDTSLWALATANNDPGRLIRADELLPRLAVWLYDGGVLIGTDGVTALLVGLALVAFTVRVWFGGFRRPEVRADGILLGYIVAYGLLHWLVAFNQHDRYLLPLLPPVILLAARGMEWLTLTPVLFSTVFRERHISESASRFPVGEGLRPSPTRRIVPRPSYRGIGEAGRAPTDGIIQGAGRRFGQAHWPAPTDGITQGAGLCAPTACLFVGIILLLLAVLLPAAWDASEGRVRVGGDRGEHTGIDALADELNAKPLATVIYDHWLGWELGYYMGAWTDKRRVYYPTPAALVADALLLPESEPRYFPAPNTAPVTPWLEALTAAGFDVSVDEQTERYTVYQLIPPVRRDS